MFGRVLRVYPLSHSPTTEALYMVGSSNKSVPEMSTGWWGTILTDYPLANIQKNNGKSSCLMGISTISMAIFYSYVKLPEVNAYHIRLYLQSPLANLLVKACKPPWSTEWGLLSCLICC